MDPKYIPARPLSEYAVEQLPAERERVACAIPVLLLEVPITGVADEVLGFVVSTPADEWYSYVYDRSQGEWRDISDRAGTTDGEPARSYQTAAGAIAEYWRANATFDDGSWPSCDGEAVDADGDAAGVRAENS
jgi:hypothetical protein